MGRDAGRGGWRRVRHAPTGGSTAGVRYCGAGAPLTASARRRLVTTALASCLAFSATPAAARPRRAAPLAVPVRILVARCADPAAPASQPTPVQTRAWVEARLRAAAELFAPHGVVLRPRIDEFQPATCDLEGRAARDAVARHVPRDDHATVLVVRRVPDLAVPDHDLSGVQWRYGGGERALAGRAYVLLTARARPTILAHELGHYFGLPHDRRGGNLMTPGPSDPVWRRRGRKPRPFQPRLRADQARRLRAGVAAFLRATAGRGGPGAPAQRR